MSDDNFQKRVNDVEQEGRSKYGEGWDSALGAIGRAAGPGGIPEPAMRQVLQRPDAAAALFTTGRDALLNEASNGDREAELQYAAIRQREREAHRKLKGR